MIISAIRNSDNPAHTSLICAMFIVLFVIFGCYGILKYYGILQNFILFLGLGSGLAIAQMAAQKHAAERETTLRVPGGYAYSVTERSGKVIVVKQAKTYAQHLVEDVARHFVLSLVAMGVMFSFAWLIRSMLIYRYGY